MTAPETQSGQAVCDPRTEPPRMGVHSGDLLAIIDRIEGLVDWHADVNASIDDTSPEDMFAHCNGLILQACKEARLLLANVKGETQT